MILKSTIVPIVPGNEPAATQNFSLDSMSVSVHCRRANSAAISVFNQRVDPPSLIGSSGDRISA